ncbi:MAG TPA: response regulator transcription factor [Microlunatus sp.]|jgi:DNA-binding NarL/FixJ family response regulator|nr:response regulator transcription factor [Microlunatus sp.]
MIIEEAAVDRDEAAPIRLLIADDQRLVRTGFRVIIGTAGGIDVVGEAADGIEAIERAVALQPDVVLMDIRMPRMDGLQATRTVLSRTATRVLILTTFDSDEYVYEALRAGASGFLLKDAPAEQLVAAVRSVAAGDALIDPAVTRRLIGTFTKALRPAPARGGAVPDRLAALTARELDVLRLIAAGLSNSEIAARLVVEDSTIKTHVGRVLTKLELRDRVQAVVLAYETGLVVPEARGS